MHLFFYLFIKNNRYSIQFFLILLFQFYKLIFNVLFEFGPFLSLCSNVPWTATTPHSFQATPHGWEGFLFILKFLCNRFRFISICTHDAMFNIIHQFFHVFVYKAHSVHRHNSFFANWH